MINPKELRIGNIVASNYFEEDVYFIIEELRAEQAIVRSLKHGSSAPLLYNNEIRPVEATEEILTKFGFNRNGLVSNNGSKMTIHHKEPIYPNGRIYWNSWCILNSIPKYLHEIQNIYFSLTKTELEIKL